MSDLENGMRRGGVGSGGGCAKQCIMQGPKIRHRLRMLRGKIRENRRREIRNNPTFSTVTNYTIKFGLWINLVTVGAIVTMYVTFSQVFLYEQCESFYIAAKMMAILILASSGYLYLLSIIVLPAAAGMFLAFLFYFVALAFPSTKVMRIFRSEMTEGSVSNIRVFVAFMALFSSIMWFLQFYTVFPEVRKLFSFESRMEMKAEAAGKCSKDPYIDPRS